MPIEMRILWQGELHLPTMPEMPAGSKIVYVDTDTDEIVDAPIGASAASDPADREEQ